ncbi:MAG: hypothetical protein JWQ49_2515 [Edaphobacter sp.]|nr:hypothetical protein [Edaphobacter sp.]
MAHSQKWSDTLSGKSKYLGENLIEPIAHSLIAERPCRDSHAFALASGSRSQGNPLFAFHADTDLGRLGDLVQLLAGRVKQEWTALVLFRIALNADSVRRYLC